MAWILLVIAGLFETAWAVTMKYSEGFERLWLTVLTFALGIVSFVLLARAMKSLEVGTSYAVWTGIGAVGAAVLGILLFGDSHHPLRIGCIALIVIGIIGLKLTST